MALGCFIRVKEKTVATKITLLLSLLFVVGVILANIKFLNNEPQDHFLKQRVGSYDPTLYAAQNQAVKNLEASVPPQCYTKTAGKANPCWSCHTQSHGLNVMNDWTLQKEYAFSDFALTNKWKNLFVDRSAMIASISDDEILSYIRTDNYKPLVESLKALNDYRGWVPDLDFETGFDESGFAKNGSYWRALRYKPFLGTFWQTNGSSDDVFIRLPQAFRKDREGKVSLEVLKLNFAILEVMLSTAPTEAKPNRKVGPIHESLAGVDLNDDGMITETIDVIKVFPKFYVGAAAAIESKRYLYPKGTEFLHSVRYLNPDADSMLALRMKELRYAIRRIEADQIDTFRVYEKEFEAKERGKLPVYAGSTTEGFRNYHGWQWQGYIEDQHGRLRLQNNEEHRYCMGCHASIGVTVDQTFSFARKLPGLDGWKYQSIHGIPDVPQLGQSKPEYAVYMERVGGGDEFRANQEMMARFFKPDGTLNEREVNKAANGEADISHLLLPSRRRALDLNKAYLTIVKEQSFIYGRDAVLVPPANVHQTIENGSTELGATGKVFKDGRLWLDWQPYNDLKFWD